MKKSSPTPPQKTLLKKKGDRRSFYNFAHGYVIKRRRGNKKCRCDALFNRNLPYNGIANSVRSKNFTTHCTTKARFGASGTGTPISGRRGRRPLPWGTPLDVAPYRGEPLEGNPQGSFRSPRGTPLDVAPYRVRRFPINMACLFLGRGYAIQ